MWKPTCSPEIALSRYCSERNILMSLGFQMPSFFCFFCCSSCRRHNKHLDHTYLISMSVKSQSWLPSPRISKEVWTPTSHMRNAPCAHIPRTHTTLQHSGRISLLWVFHPGWIEHTCATCECQLDSVEALWQDFPPNQCLPQQWSLAVRDSAALLHRRRISVPINKREDIFISEGPQLIYITCTGPGVWYLL